MVCTDNERKWLVLAGVHHLIDLLALGVILKFGPGDFISHYPYKIDYSIPIILAPFLAGIIASIQIKNLTSDKIPTEPYISHKHWWILRIPGINSVFFIIKYIRQSLRHGEEPVKGSLGTLAEIFHRSGLADHVITTYAIAHYVLGSQAFTSIWILDFFKVALIVKFCTSMIKLTKCVACNVSRNLTEINSTWIRIVLVIEAAIYSTYVVLLYAFAAHALKQWIGDISILVALPVLAIPTVLFTIGKACEVNGSLNFGVLGRGFESVFVYSNDQIGRFALTIEIIACFCIGASSSSYNRLNLEPAELGLGLELETVYPTYILVGLLILRLTITTARNYFMKLPSKIPIETENISASDSNETKKKFFQNNIAQVMSDVHTDISMKKPISL